MLNHDLLQFVSPKEGKSLAGTEFQNGLKHHNTVILKGT